MKNNSGILRAGVFTIVIIRNSAIRFLFASWLWLFLIFSLPWVLIAQEQELLFRHIGTSSGLSSNIVNCMIQDSLGYLWFGTGEGLNRFNGYENTIFKRKLLDTTTLSDDRVIKLFIDSNKRLWIGTDYGLCRYNENEENFKRYLPEKSITTINTFNRITGIVEDKNHNIFFTSEIGMLYTIKNDQLLLYKDLRQYGNIKDLVIDKSGNFWIGSLNGVVVFNATDGKVKHISGYYQHGIKKEFTRVNAICEDGDTVWIGTTTSQVGYILKRTLTAGIFTFTSTSLGGISKIYKDTPGLLFVCSKEGLFIFNKEKKRLDKLQYNQHNPNGISNNTISDVLYDRQRNLWIATQRGVNLAANEKAFKNYSFYSQKIKLEISNIQSLLIDTRGNLWLGSFDRGLNVINLSTGAGELYVNNPNNPYSVGNSSVTVLFEDSRGIVWVSSYMGYLQRFDKTTGRFISYPFDHIKNGAKEVRDIRTMVEDKQGNLWFISHGFGLLKFNPLNGHYKYFVHDPKKMNSTLVDNWAYKIIIEHDSILWIASASGLSRFNIHTETFTNYYYNPEDAASLSNNLVYTVFSDSRENIWVGTSFGLNLLNKKNNTFYHLFVNDGLPSNQIKSVIEEKPGILWIGTGYGLSRMTYTLDEKTGQLETMFRNYDRSDNLQDVFFWENSVDKSKTGELFFGNQNGVIAFQPDAIVDNMTPPEVYITEFQLFNKKVNIGETDSLFRKHIAHSKEIRLNYRQNIFSLRYLAINYISPENNRYAYKLVGFDNDWNYVGNKREATYTNLAPGKYTFIVKASNNDGIWNETGASIKITILPPWWKTWWFTALLYLTIISLAFLFYYLKMKFYRNQQQTLQTLVKERTKQLEDVAVSLEEKQEEINTQKEELLVQKDTLESTNTELDKHRNQLELLIEERTKELIEAKNKAEESDKLKSSFLANLSHEIRTPLNAILGFSSLICEEDTTFTERNDYKTIIQNSSNSLLDLISDIIDISKIEAGLMEVTFSEISLEGVVNELVGIFEMLMKKQDADADKKVSLRVNIEPELLKTTIVTDKLRLEQILSNLIGNAIKFTKEGYIEVGCKKVPDAQFLEFYVKDTGIGIKEEHLHFVFERFRKVEDDKSQLHRGTGLGLAISYQLVNLLGGNMYLSSKSSEGSVFYFTIPFVMSQVTENQKKHVKPKSNLSNLAAFQILVAEDDFSNYTFIEKLLIKTHAKIIHAINGKQVLEILQSNNRINLILMDIKMPEMDGIETLHALRKMNFNMPVIAQTAYALSNEVVNLINEGFDEYISKPINPEDFYDKISKFLIK